MFHARDYCFLFIHLFTNLKFLYSLKSVCCICRNRWQIYSRILFNFMGNLITFDLFRLVGFLLCNDGIKGGQYSWHACFSFGDDSTRGIHKVVHTLAVSVSQLNQWRIQIARENKGNFVTICSPFRYRTHNGRC